MQSFLEPVWLWRWHQATKKYQTAMWSHKWNERKIPQGSPFFFNKIGIKFVKSYKKNTSGVPFHLFARPFFLGGPTNPPATTTLRMSWKRMKKRKMPRWWPWNLRHSFILYEPARFGKNSLEKLGQKFTELRVDFLSIPLESHHNQKICWVQKFWARSAPKPNEFWGQHSRKCHVFVVASKTPKAAGSGSEICCYVRTSWTIGSDEPVSFHNEKIHSPHLNDCPVAYHSWLYVCVCVGFFKDWWRSSWLFVQSRKLDSETCRGPDPTRCTLTSRKGNGDIPRISGNMKV